MTKNKTESREIVNTSNLNDEQKFVFESLRDYIADRDDDSVYVLKGFAGTGKTYCISVLVRYILEVMYPDNNWVRIAVTGPTNKSVRVIKNSSDISNKRIIFQTVHKLLGLTEVITEDGRQEFINKGSVKSNIDIVKILIIDEISMLNDSLFQSILKYRDKLKIICMGDPAQIPPVGKIDCIPFTNSLHEEYRIKTLFLRHIMRQKSDNPIINIAGIIRANLTIPNPLISYENYTNDRGEGVEFLNLLDAKTKENFRSLISKYYKSKEFIKNVEYVKIIAWRNTTVDKMNDLVRSVIYGTDCETARILNGEKMIANSPIMKDKYIMLNTNDEFTVKSYEKMQEKISVKLSQALDSEPISTVFSYYRTRISYLDEDSISCSGIIKILHEDSFDEFNKVAMLLKMKAIRNKGKDKTWVDYYNFLRSYADVNFSYCITAHKSQGSTYNTAFILDDDIGINWNIIERNRIKYTAYTRASRKVYVIKSF